MRDVLFLDLETYSEVDIKAGTDLYARAAEIMLFAYALNDAPAAVWDLTSGDPMPSDLRQWLTNPDVRLVAHNASFEQAVLGHAGFVIDPKRWYCTMAQALAHGLPGALDKLCDILGVGADKAKLKDGKDLVRLFCCPRPKTQKLRRVTREHEPEKWLRFVEYCRNDVEAMREVHRIMPQWNYGSGSTVAAGELALWHLDQKINRRGVPIDRALVDGALATADRVKAELAAEATDLTDGEISATTQRDALLRLLNGAYGLGLDDLRGPTVERLLKSDADLPPVVVQLLNNRLAASSTSVAKYKAFARRAAPDDRLRYTIQFCGAARTGRDAGRGVQPQNFPRPVLKQKAIEQGIKAIKAGIADVVVDKPMELLSSAIRGVIAAPAGRKLAVADLSNIEGRMLAFLAGETWKLQAFADFDTCLGTDGVWYTGDEIRDAVLAGQPITLELDKKGEPKRKGHDLYALAYAKAFNVTPEAVMDNKANGDGSWRQIGKVMELALGYEGGVGAFVTFAVAYGIDLDAMAAGAVEHVPADVWLETVRAWEWAVEQGRDFGMAEQTWRVCDAFKRLWRRAHPETAAFWKELETAFRKAVDSPNTVFTARKIKAVRQGSWIRLILPSGRSLCYPAPKVDESGKITYMGINQYSRQWSRIQTYSGKLCIAEGTPVLTRRGWIPIEAVTGADEVFDGDTWVACDGNVNNGFSEVISAHGAWMTADHEVLTTEGWKSASQSKGHSRLACRIPNGYPIPRVERSEVAMGGSMRLRQGKTYGPIGLEEAGQTGDCRLLRVYAEGVDRCEAHNARDVAAPGVFRMALDGGSLHPTDAPGMEKLRRARDNGLRKLAGVVREFLAGYVSRLFGWAIARQGEQRCGVLQGELPMDNTKSPSAQHPPHAPVADAFRGYDPTGDSRDFRHQPDDDLLPPEARSFNGGLGGKTRRFAQVFDLVNCGKSNRFVIATEDFGVLIVHNCENVTQAASRDVLKANAPLIETEGYEILLPVHDEHITEAPDADDYTADRLAAIMACNPPWSVGLPLAAAGFEAYRYRKD